MKKTVLKAIVFIMAVLGFSNCDQMNLSNQEGQALIIKALSLPSKFSESVVGSNYRIWNKMKEEGYIYDPDNCSWGCNLRVTEKGKKYLLGESKSNDMFNYNVLQFEGFTIDFNQIEGISINKDQQTATIRFTLKSTNISPISRILEDKIDNPRAGELVFKKFNNGWQLESAQNQPGVDIIREIWWRRH